MSIVTIQDVIDAGGEIFGLPVKLSSQNAYYGAFVISRHPYDHEGPGVWVCYLTDSSMGGADTEKIDNAEDLEVWPDGIRVIEANETLWRVRTITPLIGQNLRCDTRALVRLEPLIPDKPAVRFRVGDYVKVVRKRWPDSHCTVIGNIYKVLRVDSNGCAYLDSGDCTLDDSDGNYYGCCYAPDELELADKPAEPEPEIPAHLLDIKTAMAERRFGKFRIDLNQQWDNPHRVLEFFLEHKILILEATLRAELGAMEYTAAHPSFAPVPKGQLAPLYKLMCRTVENEKGGYEEKIIGWSIIRKKGEL